MTNRPVRLLVSVRTAAEAQSALAGGADIIDIKEPNRGPMGQADAAIIQAITATVGSQAPVSAALGDLNISHPPQVLPDLYFVKIGLAQAPTHWQKHLTRAFGRLRPARAVVVAYADAKRTSAPAVDQVLQWAIQHRPAGLLIDTGVDGLYGRGGAFEDVIARFEALIEDAGGQFGSDDVPEVAEALKNVRTEDPGDTVLRLRETDAGQLEVRIRSNGDNLMVLVKAEEQALRQKMVEGLPELRRALDKAELVAGRVDVAEYGAFENETRGDSESRNSSAENSFEDNLERHAQGEAESIDGSGARADNDPDAASSQRATTPSSSRTEDGRLHVIV